MIARVRGLLLEKGPGSVVIDLGGLGLEIQVPRPHSAGLGETVALQTHLEVREDAWSLYGFDDSAERAMFRKLLRVPGIGPATALATVARMGVSAILLGLAARDPKPFTVVPGIGRKTAERLILELADKVKDMGAEFGLAPAALPRALPASEARLEEARLALSSLGFNTSEVARSLDFARDDLGQSATVEGLVQRALVFFQGQRTGPS